jgi:quinol monooxygenase YgiN
MIVVVVKQPVRPKYSDQWLELVEVFEDDAAGKAHVESGAFEEATRQLPKWLAGPPKIIHINGVSEGWTGVAEVPSDV